MTDDVLQLAAGGRLTVDLTAIQANYRALAGLAPSSEAAAVVKADAYGLGVRRVGPALAAAGCRTFFVAHLAEALDLRRHVPRDARILVLNGLQPGTETACAEAGLIPVLNSLEQAQRWVLSGGEGRPAALQIDSGMARLGLSAEEAQALAFDPDLSRRLAVCLVMSHLACADTPDRPANRRQLERFVELAGRLPAAPWCLANSGGALLGSPFHLDVLRLGVSLYGVAAAVGGPKLSPVVRLDARVIQVRTLAAGAGVGYGLDYSRSTPGRIATIGVGYADGWPRSLSSRGAAYFRGVALPVAGRVSMDSITLDVTDLERLGLTLGLGDEVELLGPNQGLAEVADTAGAIPYEILTGLGRRFHRSYVEGPALMKSPTRCRAS
jgi:alanine racemase